MKNSVLDIAKELEGSDLIDSGLSFKGFVNFLKERRQHEKTMKVKFLDFVIHHFEQRLGDNYSVPLDRIGDYNDLLELIYTTIFPAIEDEQDNLWALAIPIKPIIFYGTEPFYDLIRDPDTSAPRVCMIDKKQQLRNKINFELVYSVVLRRLYGYTFAPGNSLIRSLRSGSTGLLSYFRLNIDTRFIEVFPKGPLPELDPSYFEPPSDMHATMEYLTERLPLSGFRFEGFSAITVTDITADYVVESIKNIVLNPEHCSAEVHYDEVIGNLKTLSRSNGVDFGLLPLLKVNDRPVFSAEIWRHSVVARAAERLHEPEETYVSLAEEYFRDPKPVFYETIPEPGLNEHFYLTTLRKDGVRSYALVPVYYNNRPAGVLEVSSREEGVLNKEILSRLDLVMALLAQLLRKSIDDFDNRIKAIIKENFTSIQPSVEWKFHEAAWRYERMREWGETNPTLETIYFKDVYPLYGAIDIRNSTIERNSALQRDMQTQFDILVRTLRQLRKEVNLELLDDLIFQSEKWRGLLTGVLTTAEELDLNGFLKEKISVFLAHFKTTRPDTAGIIEPYFAAIEEKDGIAFQRRRELETSIQLINATINKHLESAASELQKSYPSYFEKFRTDGVEYDLYIGQSIAPDHPFDLLYLRNLRLWQLNSMASIAREAHAIVEKMPDRLLTTQLIFVHSGSIDISFRKDERRFDVEGGYNIRYQVVKKRIDKVHVRDTYERLTQPGKIAIIYFNDKEAEEYEEYIRFLQEKDVLTGETEVLELEELQGVTGLRALRVQVKWAAESDAQHAEGEARPMESDVRPEESDAQPVESDGDTRPAVEFDSRRL